jgi:8-oxo-dGTP diphosphatase
MLDFGPRNPALTYRHRAAAFGLVEREGRLACVRVEREDGAYFDLPGGAVDGTETEAEALAREFIEETGLTITPRDRIAEAGQHFLKSDGEPVYNVGGFWTAEVISEDRAAKCEDDHQLVWLDPAYALAHLRHDAHAWAVAAWMRR